MKFDVADVIIPGLIALLGLRLWLQYRAPSAMRFAHWLTLAAGMVAVCGLRLWLYHAMAHDELSQLLHLYAREYRPARELVFSDYFDGAPLLLMGILNGLTGYRYRSLGGVVGTSALMAIAHTAVHPLYQALWGSPPFGVTWQNGSYAFTAATSFVPICFFSGPIWAELRKRVNLPVPPPFEDRQASIRPR